MTKFSVLSSPFSVLLAVICAIFSTSQMNAQDHVCGTVSPTASQYQLFIEQAAIENQLKVFNPSAPFTLNVPVRVTVFLDQIGNGEKPTEAEIDVMLAQASAALSKPNSTITFQRCSGITTIKSDKLAFENIPATEYSYMDFMTSVYVLPGTLPFSGAHYPFDSPPSIAWIRGGDGDIATNPSTTIHELGHTIGLFHTHEKGGNPYLVPSTPDKFDYPGADLFGNLNPNGRELVIRSNILNSNDPRPFKTANAVDAGDKVIDTPPGCDDTRSDAWTAYPDQSNIAGCLDGNPSTPCLNTCYDNNPLTPCVQLTSCQFDRATCKYTGTYRDYNLDLIEDPSDVLVRNYMSYTHHCRNAFTTGQNDFIRVNFGAYLQSKNRIDVCGSMSDYVEWEELPSLLH